MSYQEDDADVVIANLNRANEALRNKLAAEQAYSARLRELLPKRIPNGFVSFGQNYCEQEDKFNDPCNPMCKFKRKYLSDCEETLTLPHDDTALREWGARVLRKLAKDVPYVGSGDLFVKADELVSGDWKP